MGPVRHWSDVVMKPLHAEQAYSSLATTTGRNTVRWMAHDPISPPEFLVPVSGTRNLGGELGSCAMGLSRRQSGRGDVARAKRTVHANSRGADLSGVFRMTDRPVIQTIDGQNIVGYHKRDRSTQYGRLKRTKMWTIDYV